MPKQKQSHSHSQYLVVRISKLVAKCAVVCVKYKWQLGGGCDLVKKQTNANQR